MQATNRIQTQLDKQVLKKAERKFGNFGLSLNDGVRMLVTSFANDKIVLTFQNDVTLSKEAVKRLNAILDDVESNKNSLIPLEPRKNLST